ncbi:pro-Pol polyprotein [Caerostris darwini]|uniref:Pro-Pol polyprotein n=1 Tax=Caerostris darwini TaxID=1538125 RepID=A0AAV4T2V4_9ARAC|nr:pro-Pol polyprotein [Caerostris darwini]
MAISCQIQLAQDVLEKLILQQITFGYSTRIINDSISSKVYEDYCEQENIHQLQKTRRIPRGNGQVQTILINLSLEDNIKWFKHMDKLQLVLNSTLCRSTNSAQF